MRSLRNGFLTATALALLAGGGAAQATAAERFQALTDDAAGPARGDGDRWVVYPRDGATLRVLDEQTGDSYDMRVACAGGQLKAAGGGQAIVACDRGDGKTIPRPLRLDLTPRSWHEVPGVDAVLDRYENAPSAEGHLTVRGVGTQWIDARVWGYHWGQDLPLNWRSGAVGPAQTATTAHDLDADSLNLPLCAPIARTPVNDDPFGDAPPFEPMAYEAPFAVQQTLARLTLQRCGEQRKTTLDSGGGYDFQLSDDAVSWARSNVARLYLAECGLRLSWPLSDALPDGNGLLHTERSLYLSVARRDGTAISRLPVPSCAPAARPSVTTVRSGSRSVRALSRTGSWPAVAGARAQIVPEVTRSAPSLQVAAGATVTVRPTLAAQAVRWRVGGTWRRASRATGGSWRFTAPRGLRASRTLTLHVVRPGGGVRQEVTLRPAG